VNLPNAITAARIAVAPAIAWMIVMPSWPLRLAGWILYVAAAVRARQFAGARFASSLERAGGGLLVAAGVRLAFVGSE